MKKFEYKTVTIKVRGQGVFKAKRMEGFDETLNEQGSLGWRYVDTVLQTGVYGEVSSVKMVFEKELRET